MEKKKLKKNKILWVGDAGYSTYQHLNSTIKAQFDNEILLYDEIPEEVNANVKALTDNSHHVEYSIEKLTQEIKKQFKKAEYDVLVGSPLELLFNSMLAYYTEQFKNKTYENKNHLSVKKVFESTRYKQSPRIRKERVVFLTAEDAFKDYQMEMKRSIEENKRFFNESVELSLDQKDTNQFFFDYLDEAGN
jgi:hypothetical protein